MITVAFYFREYDVDPIQRRQVEPDGDFTWSASEFVNKEMICRPNVLHSPVTSRKFEMPGAIGERSLKNPCQDSTYVGRGTPILSM
jgi:hypothetical protein